MPGNQDSASRSPLSQQTPSRGRRKQKSNPRGQSTPQLQGQTPQQNQNIKNASPGEGDTPKTKAQLRAERRALQEAQRAAKAATKQSPSTPVSTKKTPRKFGLQMQDTADKHDKVSISGGETPRNVTSISTIQRRTGFFAHLPRYQHNVSLTKDANPKIHPAILKLGLQYVEGVICGSNARCLALLGTLKQVIETYSTPKQKELSRDLSTNLKKNMDFLAQSRPLSVGMINAFKHLKSCINGIPREKAEDEAKQDLYGCIDSYKQSILLAGKAIAKNLIENDKITDGDTIMVYAFSSLIKNVLCEAHDKGKTFSVIVVDGRPKLEGREMLRRLVKHGIKCSYILISAASYVMREVTKVLLGAHALLANGYVMSRVGSSQVALIARSYNVPVLVCCETYKFTEKVQTDSFVSNELGDPNSLVQIGKKENYLSNWKEQKSLHLMNFIYDVTPSDLISMVITELGMVPCTSVPVVLRIKQV